MTENTINPSVPVNTTNTSMFTSPLNVATPIATPQGDLSLPEVKLPEVSKVKPEIVDFVGAMRFDALSSNNGGSPAWINKIDPSGGKIAPTYEVPLTETHQVLNNGETWLPKYSSYLPGVDNDTRLSYEQSNYDQITNVLKRFGSNTSKGILDIGSFAYGVGAAALTGRFDALYDNDMSKYVDDLTTKTNFKYKNYYDEASRNSGLGLNINTLDKVMGGAEFTARMMASEAALALLTSGTSLPSSMARFGMRVGLKGAQVVNKIDDVTKIGSNISKMVNMSTTPERMAASKGLQINKLNTAMKEGLEKAVSRGKLGDKFVQARFALTSPMYEAGFEAMHFKKDAEKQFYDYFKELGRDPTKEEVDAFSKKMTNGADAVFVANMAILSVSNMAMYGDLFNVKNPFAKAFTQGDDIFKQKVLKMGTERSAKTGQYSAMTPSLFNKSIAYLNPVVKGGLIEGVYEEGSQGIASNTIGNYIASAYDKNAMKYTSNYTDAFGKAFVDQFGTKEGQEELIIGALIGGLMGGVTGGIKTHSDYKNQKNIASVQNAGQKFINDFKMDAYNNEQLLSLFAGANRFQNSREKLEQSEIKGDELDIAMNKTESFIALLDAYHSVGKEAEFINMFESMFQGMDNQMFAETMRIGLDKADAFKQSQIGEMRQIAKDHSTALEAAKYLFRPNIGGFTQIEGKDGKQMKVQADHLVRSFAFATTMSNFNNSFARESYDAFQNILAKSVTNPTIVSEMGTMAALKNATEVERGRYDTLSQDVEYLTKQKEDLETKINNRVQGEDNTSDVNTHSELLNSLTNVQKLLNDAVTQRDALLDTIVDNFYSNMDISNPSTTVNFSEFKDKTAKLGKAIMDLNIPVEDKIVLTKLLGNFHKANDQYHSFAKIAEGLSDPKFTYKTYSHIMGNKIASMDKSLNDHTKDTLMEIYGFDNDRKKVLGSLFSKSNDQNIITDDKLKEGYVPTPSDIELIKDKEKVDIELTENEIEFKNKFKNEIDNYKSDPENPAERTDKATVIDLLKLKLLELEQLIDDLENGNYSGDIKEKIDLLNSEINSLKNMSNSTSIKNLNKVEMEDPNSNPEVIQLKKEISEIEAQIISMEDSVERLLDKQGSKEEVRTREYRLFTYTGEDKVKKTGNIRLNGTSVEFYNNDEVISISKHHYGDLEYIDLTRIPGLSEIQEDDVLIEGREIYINGTLFKLSKPHNTIEDATSLDENGDYQIEMRYKNGRKKIVKGNTAELLIYTELLKKFEENATNEQIKRANEKAKIARRIEEKYAELADKEKNLDSKIDQINDNNIQKLIEVDENNSDNIKEHFNQKKRNDDSIKELESEKSSVIAEEVLKLTSEYDKLQNQLSEEEFYKRLKEQRDEVRFELIREAHENGSDTVKFKDGLHLLNMIDRQLINRNSDDSTTLNENSTPIEILEWTVKNIKSLNISSVDSMTEIEKPSQEIIDEYVNLDSTSDKTDEQRVRYAELREMLLPFNIMEGYMVGEIPLIEILEIYNKSKEYQEVSEHQGEIQTEEEFTETNGEVERQAEIEKTSGNRSARTGLVFDGTYVKNNGRVKTIHHVKLETILTKAIQKGNEPRIIVYKSKKGKTTSEIDNEFVVRPGEEVSFDTLFDKATSIEVILADGISIRKNEGDSSFRYEGDLPSLLDLQEYYLLGQKTPYIQLMSENTDGTISGKESEYKITKDGIEIPFDKKELNSIKPGDEVVLEFDPNNDFNKKLKPSQYVKQGLIYVKRNGKLVQVLKATNIDFAVSSDWATLEEIRQEVIEAQKLNSTYKMKVEKSYLGYPIVTFDKEGKMIEHSLDSEKGIKYGYMDENGDVQGDLKDVKFDNTQYMDVYKGKGVRVPIMAVNTNGQTVAFPVNLYAREINGVEEVDEIWNSDTMTKGRKIIETNLLLEKYGLYTEDLAMSTNNTDITKVKEVFENLKRKIDITNKNEFEMAEKKAFINIKDPFMSNKLTFNLRISDNVSDLAKNKIEESVTSSIASVDAIGASASSEVTC